MSFVARQHEFSTAILKALGLEGRRIRKLVLRMSMDEITTVELEEIAESKDPTALDVLAGKYEVREVVASESGDVNGGMV